jgi:hypothetical protein
MTLSSSEVGFVTIFESPKEIIFMEFLLYGIEIALELLIALKTNSIGAMLMALTGVLTCHVDTRYHFIRESIE